MDNSVEMVRITTEKLERSGIQHLNPLFFDLEKEAYLGKPVDVVFSQMALHHVVNVGEMLYQFHRMLKPGGLLITKTPCLSEMNFMIRLLVPMMQAVGRAPYVAFLTKAQLEREIAAAGFEIVERAQHGSKPKPEPRIYLVARKV